MQYVVYEVWTKSKIVEADSIEDAYDKGEPGPLSSLYGLSLCNWHAVAVTKEAITPQKQERQ